MDITWTLRESSDSRLNQISPIRAVQTSTTTQDSPLQDYCLHKENDNLRYLNRITELTQDLKDKELRLGSVQRELSSMENYREQCVNLKAQIMLYIEKISHYETELHGKNKRLSELERTTTPKISNYEYKLNESRRTVESLTSELSSVKKELKSKSSELDILQSQVKSLDSQLNETMNRSRDETERYKDEIDQYRMWRETAKEEQNRLVDMLSEKEANLEEMDANNERLRAELRKAVESLQLCQNEILIIPKLQTDVSRIEKANTELNGQVEGLTSKLNEAEKELADLKAYRQELKGLCEGKDPQIYIPELTAKIKQSQVVLNQMQTDLTMIEQIQSQSTDDAKLAAERLNHLGESWADWTEKFLNSSEEPPKMQAEGNILRALEPFVTGLRRQMIRLKRDVMHALEEADKGKQDCLDNLAAHDSALYSLRQKSESFATQILQQDKLVKKMTDQNTYLEAALNKQADSANKFKHKVDELKKELKAIKKDQSVEGEELGRVLQLMRRESKGNNLANIKEIGKEVGRLLAEVAQALNGVELKAREIKHLQGTIEHNLKDYESSKLEYYSRVTTMNRQIEKLTEMVEQNDAHSHEILKRFEASEAEIEFYQAELKKAEDLSSKERQLRLEERKLAGCLMQSLKVLVERYYTLRTHKDFYADQVDSIRDRLKAALGKELSERPKTSPLSRFRSAGFAILSFIRLNRIRGQIQRGQAMMYNEVPLHLSKTDPVFNIAITGSGSELVYSVLAAMDAQANSTAQSEPIKLPCSPNSAPYYLYELHQILGIVSEARTSQHTELESKSKALVALLESRLNDSQEKIHKLEQMVSDMMYDAGTVDTLSRQNAALEIELKRSQEEVDAYKQIIRELKSTTEEMQSHTELLAARQADLIKDIDFKASHIQSQDQLIAKFKKRLDASESERKKSDNNCRDYISRLETMTSEFSKLANTCERLKQEYFTMKSRVEEVNANYERVCQDLRVKTKTVAHLEKRLQSS